MLEEEAGVMRNAMTTRAPCGAKKKTFGPVQTNPQADAWWVPLFIFLRKCFLKHPSVNNHFNIVFHKKSRPHCFGSGCRRVD